MSARDLARFALLYLRGGTWDGRQVVPADWVHESTQPYSRSGFGLGYGYLWWTATSDDPPGSGVWLPEGSFFALGAGGQYAFVIPSDDLVVVNRVDRDQHLPEPKPQMVVYLLQLILKAGGFAAGP
jgi:CubicO group peptidase (beta-lactamase class C family)